jgi:ubiquinone/menaquinone biosynthesis C-methylase UbiE
MDDTDYALGRTQAEYQRLIEQADILRPITERMLVAAGVKPGLRVLDVGCGVGDVSFLVACLVGPEGSVIGVDLDADALKFADERRAAQGIVSVEFRQSDARSADSGRLFDAAVGRLVLLYMSDPTEALRQIARRVRPGGVVTFQEPVTRHGVGAATRQPALARLNELLGETFERSGARPDVGEELYWRMLDAGLEPDSKPFAEIPLGSADQAYRRWSAFAQSMLPKMVEYGLAAEKDILDLLERLHREMIPDRGLFPLTGLMVCQWARKPAVSHSANA